VGFRKVGLDCVVKPTQTSTNQQALYTPKQLSTRWGICELTLRRWRREGRLKAIHLGRAVRFSIEEIERIEREGAE
jgi:excisionase family DNA binding protein